MGAKGLHRGSYSLFRLFGCRFFDVKGNGKGSKVHGDLVFPKNVASLSVVLHELTDGDHFAVGYLRLQCFDIHSSKEKQYGFVATFPDGKRLCCLGDEPYNPLCRTYAENADRISALAIKKRRRATGD